MTRTKKKTGKSKIKKIKRSSIAKELAAISRDQVVEKEDGAPEVSASEAATPAGKSPPLCGKSKIRNRIKRHVTMRAGDLVPHEMNFRRHPDNQKAALAGMYKEIGFARSLLAYELPDGRLKLVDGHLRQELEPEMQVTVEVLDLTEQEAKLMLASTDPLSAMAVADPAALAALLAEVDTECAELREMLDGLAVAQQEQPDADADPPPPPDDAPKEVEHVCPNCGTHFVGGQLIQGEEK